jgi:hypothetical protein
MLFHAIPTALQHICGRMLKCVHAAAVCCLSAQLPMTNTAPSCADSCIVCNKGKDWDIAQKHGKTQSHLALQSSFCLLEALSVAVAAPLYILCKLLRLSQPIIVALNEPHLLQHARQHGAQPPHITAS